MKCRNVFVEIQTIDLKIGDIKLKLSLDVLKKLQESLTSVFEKKIIEYRNSHWHYALPGYTSPLITRGGSDTITITNDSNGILSGDKVFSNSVTTIKPDTLITYTTDNILELSIK